MDRQLKYLVSRDAVAGNVWIALQHLDEMILSPHRRCFDVDADVNTQVAQFIPSQLRYIYSIFLTTSNVLMIFEDQTDYFYLIRNQIREVAQPPIVEGLEKDRGLIQILNSEIRRSSRLTTILASLTSAEKKLLNLRGLKMRSTDQRLLNLPQGFDFGHGDQDACVWREWIKNSQTMEFFQNTLNLANAQILNGEFLWEHSPVSPLIKEISLYQNVMITSWKWLQRFPNLETLNCTFCTQLSNKSIGQICQFVPRLRHLNLTQCPELSLELFIPVLRHSSLETIWIERATFLCQTNPYRNLILPGVWKQLESRTLKKICITSDNLTADVLVDLMNACPNLEHLVMSQKLLESRVGPNLIEGSDDSTIKFQAYDNSKVGISLKKPVKIRQLLRDRYEEAKYSESMLQKIKQLEQRSDVVPESLDHSTNNPVI